MFNSIRRTLTSRSSASSSTFSKDPSSSSSSSSKGNETGKITLQGSCEFSEVEYKASKEILVMASLKAPVFEVNPEDKRAPIDVCCVIDRSGSMAGEKMNLAKKALQFVVENTDSTDSLSIVIYDTNVDTLIPFTRMDKDGKSKTKVAIDKILTADMTNLCGGLLRGLDLAKERKKPNDICSILLFTDGLANQGIVETPKITAEMEKKLSGFSKKPTVFTFGFGTDHNQNMLRAIAEGGGGMYYYLSDADKIPLSFADCLGGLQSIVAQNLTLQVEGLEKVQILKSLNPKFKISKGTVPGAKITIDLGDLYSEETRDIIFLVQLPALKESVDQEKGQVKFVLKFFNALTSQDGEVEALASLIRPENAKATANVTLDKQRNRIQAAEAMESSRKLADQGDLENARKLLEQARETITQSPSATDQFCQNLAQELQQCSNEMRDRNHYMTEGAKIISRKEQSHYYQRSNKIEDEEISFYETSSKSAFKERSRGF